MSILRFHELSRVINARVTRESYIKSRENDFLVMLISRRVVYQIAYVTRHWKGRVIFYRLIHILLKFINYRSSYTVSKIAEIDENRQKLYFRVHLTKRILHV